MSVIASFVSELNLFAEVLISSYVWPILWQSTLLVLIVAIAAKVFFKKASPQFRYLLWLLVILRLFLSPELSLPTGIGHWGRALLSGVAKAIDPGQSISGNPSAHGGLMVSTGAPSGIEPGISGAAWLLLGWMAIVTALTIYLVRKTRRFRQLLAQSTPPPENLTALVERCAREVGIRRRIRICVTRWLPSPVVCGIFRPTLVMPRQLLERLERRELIPVIVHELAHIKRQDCLVNWIQIVAGVVYFFNPLLWWVNRQIRFEREKACDDRVLIVLHRGRKRYVDSLLKVLQQVTFRSALMPGLIGVFEQKSNLTKRVLRILDHKIRPTARLRLSSMAALLVFACCFMTFAAAKNREPNLWNETDPYAEAARQPLEPENITLAQAIPGPDWLRRPRQERPEQKEITVEIKEGKKIYCAWSNQLIHNDVAFRTVSTEESTRYYDDGTHDDEIPFDGLPSSVQVNNYQYLSPYAVAIKEKMEELKNKVLTTETLDEKKPSRFQKEGLWDPQRFYCGMHVTSLDEKSTLPKYSNKLIDLSEAMQVFDETVLDQFQGYEYYPDKEHPEWEQALWRQTPPKDPKARKQWAKSQPADPQLWGR